MKTNPSIVAAIIIVILAVGCAKDKDANRIIIPKNAADMAVTFTWDGIAACTHDSPEIRVTPLPAGTAVLQALLKDINLPAYNHGGGTVDNDGTGIIPAGALTVGYNGPCPPPGERHKYEFSVYAKDADGVIIGFGRSRQTFPPKR